MTSLKASKSKSSTYDVYIVDAGLTSEDRSSLSKLAGDGLNIHFVMPTQSIVGLHIAATETIASATETALYKFYLPNLQPNEDRVLYLDADTLIREDLSWLAAEGFQGKAAMAVADSGVLYYRRLILDQISRYFNSGFMMLDLNAFREHDFTSELIRTKREKCTGRLVDQDAFNLVLDGKVRYLSIRHNCLCANLRRAERKFNVSDLNEFYATNYRSLEEVFSDAAVVHFASHDKPWKYSDLPFWDEWLKAYKESPYHRSLKVRRSDNLVSIIIPVYNVDQYLPTCLDSIVAQSFRDIEIICVNDGSSERSLAVLEAYAALDDRLTVINQGNRGQSAARNVALSNAQGKYSYSMDGDDTLDLEAVRTLFDLAETDQLEIVVFNGATIFDNEDLAE